MEMLRLWEAWGCLEERMDNIIIISSSAIAGELAATGRELQLLQVSQPPLWLPWLPCTGIRGASLCYQTCDCLAIRCNSIMRGRHKPC